MRNRHVWILTSPECENTFGVVGVFKTEEEGNTFVTAAGLKEGTYQLTGWEVEKK